MISSLATSSFSQQQPSAWQVHPSQEPSSLKYLSTCSVLDAYVSHSSSKVLLGECIQAKTSTTTAICAMFCIAHICFSQSQQSGRQVHPSQNMCSARSAAYSIALSFPWCTCAIHILQKSDAMICGMWRNNLDYCLVHFIFVVYVVRLLVQLNFAISFTCGWELTYKFDIKHKRHARAGYWDICLLPAQWHLILRNPGPVKLRYGQRHLCQAAGAKSWTSYFDCANPLIMTHQVGGCLKGPIKIKFWIAPKHWTSFKHFWMNSYILIDHGQIPRRLVECTPDELCSQIEIWIRSKQD